MPRRAAAKTPNLEPEDQGQQPSAPPTAPPAPPARTGPQPFGPDRFERFTARAKKVLTLAQEEAGLLQHNYIGTEHLLLGLVRESEGIAAKVLITLGVEIEKVRSSVEFIIGRGDKGKIGNPSLTPRSKKVIELAIEEARHLNHNYVGTEHLLLGLIREGEGIAAGVLISLGVDMDQAREQVIRVVGQASGQSGGRSQDVSGGALPALPDMLGPKGSVVTCRVDSSDLEAMDALIETGIRSTRSDAAAWLIHAGIQANLDLFDQVYTTVAEIRRLREQAQSAAKDLEARGPKGGLKRDGRPTPDA